MKTINKLLLTTAFVTILSGAALGSSQVFAQTRTADPTPMSDLAKRIADTFGLKQDEVEAVFNQERQEQQTKRSAEYEARLAQLVTQGKITELQKQLIIAKQKELQASHAAKMTSMDGKTPEEHKAAMETERAALREWAKQNGIDARYLMFKMRGKGTGMHSMM